jgi:hypothetical protein
MNNLLLNNNTKKINPQIQKIKDMQRIREYEKINKIETITGDKLRDIIIKPAIITKDANLNEKVSKRVSEHGVVEEYWKKRTNMPYKNILKNEDYTKTIKNEDDLIIYKVTNQDKDKKEFDNKFMEIKKNINEHNNELKKIYSSSEETLHKKKFEYNHRYKDQKKYNPSSFNELKKDYKEENLPQMVDKENIINQLVSNGIFNDDELKMFGIQ